MPALHGTDICSVLAPCQSCLTLTYTQCHTHMHTHTHTNTHTHTHNCIWAALCRTRTTRRDYKVWRGAGCNLVEGPAQSRFPGSRGSSRCDFWTSVVHAPCQCAAGGFLLPVHFLMRCCWWFAGAAGGLHFLMRCCWWLAGAAGGLHFFMRCCWWFPASRAPPYELLVESQLSAARTLFVVCVKFTLVLNPEYQPLPWPSNCSYNSIPVNPPLFCVCD